MNKLTDAGWVLTEMPKFKSRGPATEPREGGEPVSLDCRHRSEAFTLSDCKTCRGNVQIKVFQCRKFGECSLGGRIGMSCEACVLSGDNK